MSIATLTTELRDACNHPSLRLAWVHDLLHQAADEIERLRRVNAPPSEAEIARIATALIDYVRAPYGYWTIVERVRAALTAGRQT